jgi:hypothetical protein
MTKVGESRAERLVEGAASSLDSANLWFVLTAIPERVAVKSIDSESSVRVREWLRSEASTWPAPLKVGEGTCELRPGAQLVFFSKLNAGPLPKHYCELHADGASLIAIQIGNQRDAVGPPGMVWAIGEGALAWLSVCLLRLAAAWADREGVPGAAAMDLRILCTAAPKSQVGLQIWNFAQGDNAPASEVRNAALPVQQRVDLIGCLSSEATLIARSLLLPLLKQFGLDDSRHIDAAGIIASGNFTGHAQSIAAWAKAIGADCR